MAEDSIANRASFLDLAGSKLRARLSSNLNESASEGVTSKFARRHLEKLGWEEGTGLGKRRSGIVSHIKVERRVDEHGGLGKSSVDENLKIGNEWWKHSVGDTLAKLSTKKKKSKKKDKKEKKKTFTDEELFDATGGARFGMRAGKTQKGKWKRSETNLKEQEEDAKDSIEWNGQTVPKVILSSSSKKKVTKRKREIDEVPANGSDVEEEKKKKKQKKKGTKRKRAIDEVPGDGSDVKEDKKKKKQKKKKNEKKSG